MIVVMGAGPAGFETGFGTVRTRSWGRSGLLEVIIIIIIIMIMIMIMLMIMIMIMIMIIIAVCVGGSV